MREAVVTTRAGLVGRRFTEFVPFVDLPNSDVPLVAGVYAVVRMANDAPQFLPASPAGRHKGRNPTVDVSTLNEHWVRDVEVLYIGKATTGARGRRGLRKRLDEYRRHGAGEPKAHWGGRYVWQLADSGDLLVGWLPTPDQDASEVEAEFIASFISATGRLPFANLKRERVRIGQAD